MILSAEHTIFFTAGGVIFSIGGAWITLRNTTKKAEEAIHKADAIGRKYDEMKNEIIEMKVALEKDIESLRSEIKHFNDNHVTRQDIEQFVTKKECSVKFSGVVQKSELDLILEKLDLRFTHLEQDNKEIKKDIKDILKILKERI